MCNLHDIHANDKQPLFKTRLLEDIVMLMKKINIHVIRAEVPKNVQKY